MTRGMKSAPATLTKQSLPAPREKTSKEIWDLCVEAEKEFHKEFGFEALVVHLRDGQTGHALDCFGMDPEAFLVISLEGAWGDGLIAEAIRVEGGWGFSLNEARIQAMERPGHRASPLKQASLTQKRTRAAHARSQEKAREAAQRSLGVVEPAKTLRLSPEEEHDLDTQARQQEADEAACVEDHNTADVAEDGCVHCGHRTP